MVVTVTYNSLPSSYERHRRELLVAAVPRCCGAILVPVAFYLINEIVRDDLSVGDLAYYFSVVALPALLVALPRPVWQPKAEYWALAVDLMLALALTGRLAVDPHVTVSGTSQMLALKMVATALMVPWPVAFQSVAAVASVAMYFGFLGWGPGWPMGAIAVHQWLGPIIGAVFSIAGCALLNRSRSDLFEKTLQAREAVSLAEAEKRALESIASGEPLELELAGVCHFVEELCPGLRCAVLVVDRNARRLSLGAAPSLPDEVRSAADGLLMKEGAGTCGSAAFRNTSIIVDDIQTSDLIGGELRAMLARHGLRSCWSSPVRDSAGQVLGVVTSYGDRPGQPSATQQAIVERALYLARIALERNQSEFVRRQQSNVFASLARIGRTLMAALGDSDLLSQLCRVSAEAMEAESGIVFLIDRDRTAVAPAAQFGLAADTWQALKVVRIPSADLDALFRYLDERELVAQSSEVGSLLPAGLQAGRLGSNYLLFGLRRGGDIVGVLTVHGRAQQLPTWSEALATGLLQLVSLSLENARLLDELEDANRVKSDFVATMSHELRTPLNVILGYHEMLGSGELGALSADQRQVVERLSSSARGLLDLVNATLDLSRLEAGHVDVTLADIDPRELLQTILAECAGEAEAKSLQLVSTLPPMGATLHTDAVKLRIIVANLLRNAIKFTDSGDVELTATDQGTHFEVVVRDTGIGIEEKARTRIFGAFEQANPSVASRFGGAGLGLHIVHRLVDLLGGELRVDSKVGEGSTFTVRLPH